MKLCLTVIFCFGLGNICSSERIKLVTHNNNFNFFPLKSNYLELNVKADENVKIVLTNSYQIEPPYYEIILGANGNTLSSINRDGKVSDNHRHVGNFLATNNYMKIWIRFERNMGVVKVGSSYNKPILYFVDANFIPPSYFGVSTDGKSPGLWDFGTELIKNCTKTESIDRIIYEKCIKLDNAVFVPDTYVEPDAV